MNDLEALVASVPFWWHSIELPNDVVTPGRKSVDDLEYEWWLMSPGDLAGKTVLDIGAWDGWLSFRAEREGAKRVVALDHYIWSIDFGEMYHYEQRCKSEGVRPQLAEFVPSVWHPETLPGKRGFDIARESLNSHVEAAVGDFMFMDLDNFGTFDVVIYLGVLYHMKHPMLALERLRKVTSGVAYIESQAIEVPGRSGWSVCEFYENDELNGDGTNWWAPTMSALIAMCRAAGFSSVEALSPVPQATTEIVRYGAMVKAIP